MHKYSIGIDIGTTSTKAILFNDSGEVLEEASVGYPLLNPEPKAAEQDPDDIVTAVKKATRIVIQQANLSPKQINFLSFSAAMHSLIALDEAGKPLTASITWADQRSEKQATKLKETNGQEIYEKTGTPIHSMSPLVKLIWLREEKPEIFNQAALFLGIKEYVFYELFGEYVCDYSIASATGLFNIHTLDWDEEALKTARISKEQLPRLVPTTEIFTNMKEDVALELGLSSKTPVVIGANDGCLANLGVNAIESGVVALTIGTSGAIRTVVDRPITDPEGRIFCYALTENHWVVGGAVNNGGMIYNWMMEELADVEIAEALANNQSPYDLMTEKISSVKAGSNGLLFYPYLSGERAPLWNANAKGSFYGLSLIHKKEHMMRAVLEGINLNLYLVYRALETVIGQPEKIHASGGFAKSPLWRQMVADIFNTEVHTSQTVESSALGAVFLGRFAMGELASLEEGIKLIGTAEINQPQVDQVEVYQELIPIYEKIGHLLESGYDEITNFQQKFKPIIKTEDFIINLAT